MENIVSVKLLFFAKSRELAGVSECEINLPERIECSKLIKLISETYNLQPIEKNFLIAVNGDYCDEPNALLKLSPNDEVAIIPPISGG